MWWSLGDAEFLPSADLRCLPLVPGHIRGWGWQQTKLEDGWLVSVLEEKIQEAETSEVSVLDPGAVQWGNGGQPAVWPHVSSHLVSGKVISSHLISQWPPCHMSGLSGGGQVRGVPAHWVPQLPHNGRHGQTICAIRGCLQVRDWGIED